MLNIDGVTWSHPGVKSFSPMINDFLGILVKNGW